MCWNVSLFVVSVLHRGEELPTKRRKRKKKTIKKGKKRRKKKRRAKERKERLRVGSYEMSVFFRMEMY